MRIYLLIALGGALGSVLRFYLTGVLTPHLGAIDGWVATLAVNVTGSFAIGLIFAATGPGGRWPVLPQTQLFLMSGICGGYTTFSSFSLLTLNLLREGYPARAAANIGASVAFCLAGAWLGCALGASLSQPR